MKQKLNQLRDYYEKNEARFAIGFFVGGFIFDLLLLDRIDSWMTIGQQAFYLVVIWLVMIHMFFEEGRAPLEFENMPTYTRWYYEYRVALTHFFFGALLNSYTLFFFKSSSLITSFIFLLFMIVLLVANESHRFKKSGLTFKFALLSLCFFCFAAAVVPIMAGSLGMTVFLLSMVTGSIPITLTGWWIPRQIPGLLPRVKSQILVPMALVLLSFLTLYFFKLIPPVPLSIPFIGVYHSVEKVGDAYRLGHERPWWRFWHNGDQVFHAQRTDRVYVFFSVFSPTNFSDQVLMRWYWKDNSLGWTLQDTIPIKIVGGREEGFRGFGVKSNYQPGEWKVQVETRDEREIGRVYFTLDIVPEQAQVLQYDEI